MFVSFTDTSPTQYYTLSLHDALPISTTLFRNTAEIHAEIASFVGDFDLDPSPSGIVRRVSIKVLPLAKGKNLNRHAPNDRSEEHTSELQSPMYLVCRLLLEKKKKNNN